MKSYALFKAACAASLAALLAACGGGGGDAAAPGAAPLPEVAWASPAVFVTPGASSKSFALAGCRLETRSEGGNYIYVEEEERSRWVYFDTTASSDIYTATMVIESNGNVSLKAATAVTGTISSLWSMAFTDAREITWAVSGSIEAPEYTLNGYQNIRNQNQYMDVYSSAEDSQAEFRNYKYQSIPNSYTNTYATFDCEMTNQLALQVNADQARAAKNLGTAAGVNMFDNYDVEGRIESGKAFWADEYAMPQFSNLRFDLATGELASSSSTTGTYSPISLALPTGATGYGEYSESIRRGSSEFGYKDAKGICLSKTIYDVSDFIVNAIAYGNRFYPFTSERYDMERSVRDLPQGRLERNACGNREL